MTINEFRSLKDGDRISNPDGDTFYVLCAGPNALTLAAEDDSITALDINSCDEWKKSDVRDMHNADPDPEQ